MSTHEHLWSRGIKIVLPFVMTVILFCVAIFYIEMPLVKHNILNMKREMIRQLVESAESTLDYYYRLEQKGILTHKQAQAGAVANLRNMRYGKDNKDYFWIIDMNHFVVLNPYRPDLEGKDWSQLHDPNGKYFIQEFVKTVKYYGAGYAEYMWQWKDDPKRIVPKISYIKGFEPWDWIIGTGVYIEDVQAAVAVFSFKMFIMSSGILIIVSLFCFLNMYLGFLREKRRGETEKQELKYSLKENLEKYKALCDNISNGVALYKAINNGDDFIIVDFNLAAAKIENIPQEDVIGKTVLEVFPGVKEFGIFEVFQRVWKTGAPEHYPVKLYKDGRICGWRENYVYKLPSGEIVAVYTDETARVLAQEEILKFKTIADNANFAVCLCDTEGDISYINNYFAGLLGFPIEEILGKHFSLFFNKEQIKEVNKLYKQLFSTQSFSAKEVWHTRKDGAVFPMLVSGVLIQDNTGKPLFIAVSGQDITEHKEAEEKLRQSEQKYRSVVDNVGLGIAVMSVDMKVLAINRQMEKYYPEVDFSAKPVCYKIFNNPPRETPCTYCPTLQTLKDGNVHEAETETPTGDQIVNYRLVSSPIKDEQDNIVAAIEIVEDITAYKRMRDELLKAMKLESVGILAGGIAHDFNNLLTAILGNISLILVNVSENEKIHRFLKNIENASFRARDLSQQLLTFSKGGAPVKKVTSIAALIKEYAHFSVKILNIKYEFDIPDDLYAVDIDTGQINQVITNLVVNAEQAMPDGGLIKIKAQNIVLRKKNEFQLPAGVYVKISINDQGCGISEEHLGKVFDPFFTTKAQGSGLGLATAYSIIKRHSGYIDLDSKPGVGTGANFYIPAVGELSPVNDEVSIPKGKILVMDDEEMDRDILGVILKHLGYEVEYACDGEKAIEMYSDAVKSGTPYDAVIVDLVIPGGMNGTSTIQKLRESYPDVKALMATGYSTDPAVSQFKEYGFAGVVNKPLSINDLNNVLCNILHMQK